MADSESPAQIDFWEERYQANQTGWDIGQPAPPFVDFMNGPHAAPPGRMIVLGSGSGNDALFFAEKGFEVLGIDFAPSAVEKATERSKKAGLSTRFEQRNIFELLPEYQEAFDYVLEYTCFCAIPVEQRPDYVQLVHGLLKPQGKIIAVFFTHGKAGGPPYDTNPRELRQLFSDYFEFERLEPVQRSAPQRQNEETFGLLKKIS
jgi:SAM-dependent methyltransferase